MPLAGNGRLPVRIWQHIWQISTLRSPSDACYPRRIADGLAYSTSTWRRSRLSAGRRLILARVSPRGKRRCGDMEHGEVRPFKTAVAIGRYHYRGTAGPPLWVSMAKRAATQLAGRDTGSAKLVETRTSWSEGERTPTGRDAWLRLVPTLLWQANLVERPFSTTSGRSWLAQIRSLERAGVSLR